MSSQLYGDELEKEIILLHQELILKRTVLNECQEKLNEEISRHQETKLDLSNRVEENNGLRVQLEASLAATQKLEEENNKNRQVLIKLQCQTDAYLTERQQLVDRCYQMEVENEGLKNEAACLKEQLKAHVAFQRKYKLRQLENARLVEEISRKQEDLKKEYTRLESTCKEALKFGRKVSEEANFQAKFVCAADASQRKMEEELIRLMGALRQAKEKEKSTKLEVSHGKVFNYLDEWKCHQQETKIRIEKLVEENKGLAEELIMAMNQIELLTKNCLGEAN